MEKLLLNISVFIILLLLSVSLAFGLAINLPQTDQKQCYDIVGAVVDCAGSGQDGDIRAGVAWPNPRFTVGTGTESDCVTDNLTGLMWTRNANIINTQLWADAVAAANNFSLCGYTDWRLPNVIELESLVHEAYNEELCGGSACVYLSDWLNANGFENVQENWYWTSTTYASSTGNAWFVSMGGNGGDMGDGFVHHGAKANSYLYVWTVRGTSTSVWKTGQTDSYTTGDDGDLKTGVAWPNPRFSVGPGTESDCVTDNLTGLMWTKDASRFGQLTWQQALAESNGMNLCGYADWRLPNRKELFSLLDHSQYNPVLPPGHPFENVQTQWHWTSTSNAIDTSGAWAVDMLDGFVGAGDKDYIWNYLYIWPVRGYGCLNKGVKVGDAAAAYTYIQDAYAAAVSPQTIRAVAVTFKETLNFSSNKIINLLGGYDCNFAKKSGFTRINGNIKISNGTITIDRVIIK
jgi:hypothetical protein